jgi:hypothetical protein
MELLGDVGHVESHFSPYGTVLVLVQDRCMVYAKHIIGSETFWMKPMVLLGDEAQLEARFGLFGDSVNLHTRYVHGLHRMNHRLRNSFGCTR